MFQIEAEEVAVYAAVIGTAVAVLGLPFVILQWNSQRRAAKAALTKLQTSGTSGLSRRAARQRQRDFASVAIALEMMRATRKKNDLWRAAFINLVEKYSLDIVEEVAESGNVDALLFLGLAYIEGIGIEEDEAKCVLYLERAARENDPDALVALAYAYAYGPLEKDEASVLSLIQRAAKSGHPVGQAALADAYAGGKFGLGVDEAKAISLFERAIAQGSAAAMMALGDLLLFEKTDRRKRARGEDLVRKAAKAGYIRAKFSIAIWEKNGRHGERMDLTSAKRKLIEIAENPDTDSYTAHLARGWIASWE